MQSKNNFPPLCPFDSSSQGSPHSARPAAPSAFPTPHRARCFIVFWFISIYVPIKRSVERRAWNRVTALNGDGSRTFCLVDLDLPLSVSACDCRSRENSPSESRSSPNWVLKPRLQYIYIYICSFCTAIGALLYVNATSTVAHEVLNTTTLTIKGKLHWATQVLFDLPKARHAAHVARHHNATMLQSAWQLLVHWINWDHDLHVPLSVRPEGLGLCIYTSCFESTELFAWMSLLPPCVCESVLPNDLFLRSEVKDQIFVVQLFSANRMF